jgi:hypothetical protein
VGLTGSAPLREVWDLPRRRAAVSSPGCGRPGGGSAAFPVFVAWEGTGTHLGRFTGSETLCLDFSGSLIAYANQWTTANGDQLFGYGSILRDPPVQMIYEPGGSWEISGVHFVDGTGRFQGATGSVRYVGDHSLGANVGGIYAGDGWISTVGSGK